MTEATNTMEKERVPKQTQMDSFLVSNAQQQNDFNKKDILQV